MRVKLNDVADRITGNVDRFNTDLIYYVGGEHYDCGSIAIYNRGILDSEKGSTLGFKFHFPFQAGDTLFMARNPHLKKAGMVMYDGITSDASYILRTKNADVLLPKYLPLVIQNDLFWDFFEANKSGSVNYLMNWKEMKDYEFELPSISEQRKVANLVWTAEECRKKYLSLKEKTDDLIKSQFIEMFGDPDSNPMGWPKVTFEEISDLITDGEHATPRRCDEGIYLLSARNVLNHSLSFDEVDYIDQEEFDRIAKRLVPKAGDVLISCSGTVGRVCTVPENLKFQLVRSVALVRFKKEINPVFMEYQISMPYIQNQIDASKSQTSQANLFQGKIKKLTAIVPSTELQDKFLEFVKQSDKSKFAIQKSIESTEELIHSLIQGNY